SHTVRKLKVQKRIAQRPLPEREHGRQDRRCQQRQEARADSKKQVFTVLLPLAFPEVHYRGVRRRSGRRRTGVATPAPNEDETCAFVRQGGCGPPTNRQASFGTLSKRRPKAAAVDVSGSAKPRWIRSG